MSADLQTIGQRRRIAWLAVVLGVAGIVLLARLAGWQLFPHPEVTEQTNLGYSSSIQATRGSILDANGEYLAVSTVHYDLGLSPNLLSDKQKEEYAPLLAAALSLSPEDTITPTLMLEKISRTDTLYVPLGSDLPAEVGQAIEEMESNGQLVLDAFKLELTTARIYPDGGLAAHVLGFLQREAQGEDAREATGYYGLEEYYNTQLGGEDGSWEGVGDSWGKLVLASLNGYQPAHDGADLVLTLDRNIQYEAERILREGMEENKASSGTLVVVDPRTGGVLAMANAPGYSPGDYQNVDSSSLYINSAVSSIYEPGSVFKALTLAAALDAQVIRSTDTYDDRGELTIGGRTIYNADREAHGVTTMTGLLAHSYNVGAAHVAVLLGPTRFYEAMRRFGIGEKTGIDLAHEVAGIMRVPTDSTWQMSDLGTNSYGQGVATTPLQVVMAYAALANDGVLMRPYIVSEIRDGDNVQVTEPVTVRHAVSAETAQAISQMLVEAVRTGMPQAMVEGYNLAGKSGTAGIADSEGYSSADVVASFIGYGPVPDARFVILVKYEKPQEDIWGVEVAAPAFAEMAAFLLDYYGIPPTNSTTP